MSHYMQAKIMGDLLSLTVGNLRSVLDDSVDFENESMNFFCDELISLMVSSDEVRLQFMENGKHLSFVGLVDPNNGALADTIVRWFADSCTRMGAGAVRLPDPLGFPGISYYYHSDKVPRYARSRVMPV